jgi:hypothetical protein
MEILTAHFVRWFTVFEHVDFPAIYVEVPDGYQWLWTHSIIVL